MMMHGTGACSLSNPSFIFMGKHWFLVNREFHTVCIICVQVFGEFSFVCHDDHIREFTTKTATTTQATSLQ